MRGELRKCHEISQLSLQLLFWMKMKKGQGPSIHENGKNPSKSAKKQGVIVGKCADPIYLVITQSSCVTNATIHIFASLK